MSVVFFSLPISDVCDMPVKTIFSLPLSMWYLTKHVISSKLLLPISSIYTWCETDRLIDLAPGALLSGASMWRKSISMHSIPQAKVSWTSPSSPCPYLIHHPVLLAQRPVLPNTHYHKPRANPQYRLLTTASWMVLLKPLLTYSSQFAT